MWFNGQKIADSSNMAGMFKRFSYNITNAIDEEGPNYLAVKIYPVDHPWKTRLAIEGIWKQPRKCRRFFKDETLKMSGGWDCALPARDRNMGIYQPVYLTFTGDVDIIDPLCCNGV